MGSAIEFETRRPVVEIRRRPLRAYDELVAKGIAFVLGISSDRKYLLGLARSRNFLPFQSNSMTGILHAEDDRIAGESIRTITATTEDPKTHEPRILGIYTDYRIRKIIGFFLSDGQEQQEVRIDPISFVKAAKAVRHERKKTSSLDDHLIPRQTDHLRKNLRKIRELKRAGLLIFDPHSLPRKKRNTP